VGSCYLLCRAAGSSTFNRTCCCYLCMAYFGPLSPAAPLSLCAPEALPAMFPPSCFPLVGNAFGATFYVRCLHGLRTSLLSWSRQRSFAREPGASFARLVSWGGRSSPSGRRDSRASRVKGACGLAACGVPAMYINFRPVLTGALAHHYSRREDEAC